MDPQYPYPRCKGHERPGAYPGIPVYAAYAAPRKHKISQHRTAQNDMALHSTGTH